VDSGQLSVFRKNAGAKKMSGKTLIWLLTTVLLTTARPIEAQQPGRIPRIGFLAAVSPSAVSDRIEVFRQALRQVGYSEGKNIVIESRYAEGKLERLPDLAAELVRLKVDVILSGGPGATRPAKKETATIPIVMAFDTDPVGNGFVESLARPGGNIPAVADGLLVDLSLWGTSIINLVVECPDGKYFGSIRVPRNIYDHVLEFLKRNHGRKLREVIETEIDISDVIQ
jgi:ABC transporter substrate binding protein